MDKQDVNALGRSGLERMAEQAKGNARQLAAVADLAFRLGATDRAFALGEEARAAAPGDPEIAALTGRAIAQGVPDWHFSIVQDEGRNQAWEDAIKAAVREGDTVLDIGAGTGLLAMMAARAGAGQVISCEMNPAVAATAAAIVAANGYAEKVKVVGCHSTELDMEAIAGRKADVIVSEIIANDMIGEGAIDVIADAARRLLAPGGKMIPSSGEVRVALGYWPRLEAKQLSVVAGFDLSAFNRLQKTPYQVRTWDQTLELRSDIATLFAFDFTAAAARAPRRAQAKLTSVGGVVNGVAQWLRVNVDERTVYENAPGSPVKSSWAILYSPLAKELSTEPGQSVAVEGACTADRLHLWAREG